MTADSFIKNFIWSVGGQFFYILVLFVTNLIFAKFLSPAEFGQVAIVSSFLTVGRVLSESGLSGALVRMQKVNEEQYSSVFLFNLLISSCFVLVMIFSSQFFSNFFNDPQLKLLLSISSINLIVYALCIIPTIRLLRELRFREKALYDLISVVIASVIGISLAAHDFGVWSFLIFQFALILTSLIIFKWRMGSVFSFKMNISFIKEIFSFGANTTISSLIQIFSDFFYQIALGRYFSYSEVGFFYQAKKIQDAPVGVFRIISTGVVFSTMSKFQDELISFYSKFSNIFNTLVLFFGLLVSFMLLFSDEIFDLFFAGEWVGSVYYFEFLILGGFFLIIDLMIRVIFKVFNMTNLIVWSDAIKCVIQLIGILLSIFLNSLYFLLWFYIISFFISVIFCLYHIYRIHSDWSKSFVNDSLFILVYFSVLFLLISVSDRFFIVGIWMEVFLILGFSMFSLILFNYKKMIRFEQLISYLK